MRGTSTDDPSGHALAEAAYDAGAVEPTEATPNHDVDLRIVVRGDSDHVQRVAEQIAVELLARSDVTMAAYSVTER